MLFAETIRNRRRRAFFAAELKTRRLARDMVNAMFDNGVCVGNHSIAKSVCKSYYLAVKTGKNLSKWEIILKFATVRAAIDSLITHVLKDKKGGV